MIEFILVIMAALTVSYNAYLMTPMQSWSSMSRYRSRNMRAFAVRGNDDAAGGSNDDLSKGIIPTGKDLSSGTTDSDGSSALARLANGESIPSGLGKKPPSERAKKYIKMVEDLTPNEMLVKFTQKSPKNVQEAAKSTVMSILGTLPSYALDAAIITTSSKLANLIYQMQLTGYMLKNAEYRMSLTRTLKGMPKLPEQSMIRKGNFSASASQLGTSDDISVKGSVNVTNNDSGTEATIDAKELTTALSKEVESLRKELFQLRGEREKELQSNLLTYVQALPEQEMVKLSSGMSEDVMDAFAILVDSLLSKLNISNDGSEVAVQQSMGALAQLCMWQLTVGYTLREQESFDTGVFFDE